MSDPDRIASAVGAHRTDAIIAAMRADADNIRQTVLTPDGIGAYGQYRARQLAAMSRKEPAPRMTVRELHALLTEHLSYGRGDDDVCIYPGGPLGQNEPFMDAWGSRYNYQIIDIDWTDDDDHFVTLTIDRTPEES